MKTYLFNALKFSTLYKEVTTNWKSLFTPDKFSTLILIYKEDGESQTLANLSKKNTKKVFFTAHGKIELVIKKVRWKAMNFSDNEKNDSKTDWYELKVNKLNP